MAIAHKLPNLRLIEIARSFCISEFLDFKILFLNVSGNGNSSNKRLKETKLYGEYTFCRINLFFSSICFTVEKLYKYGCSISIIGLFSLNKKEEKLFTL